MELVFPVWHHAHAYTDHITFRPTVVLLFRKISSSTHCSSRRLLLHAAAGASSRRQMWLLAWRAEWQDDGGGFVVKAKCKSSDLASCQNQTQWWQGVAGWECYNRHIFQVEFKFNFFQVIIFSELMIKFNQKPLLLFLVTDNNDI